MSSVVFVSGHDPDGAALLRLVVVLVVADGGGVGHDDVVRREQLQLPNGGEQWLGGYAPSMYSNLVNRLGSLNVVQNLTRSPNAPKQTSA